uniref:Magnetosome protein MamI-1 n=1 Tax=Candidatus Magnetananas rongchengensis TaxID=1463558 RepID=A0A3Q8AXQ2_9BACT|nr:magnetosome protein MamI-1 [Candidatus Magnetananas rongchenensis]
MRKGHIIGGVLAFSTGLFFSFYYSVYVVEVIKGVVQPVFIVLGFIALAVAVFGKTEFKKINYVVAVVSLILGFYGLYDEYYAVLDFLYGFVPILLIVTGVIGVVHGIKKLS